MKLKKCMWSVILVIAMTASLGTAAAVAADAVGGFEKLFRGDMNADQKYSLRDAAEIMKEVEGKKAQSVLADVTLDGMVDLADVQKMFRLYLDGTGTYGMYTYAVPTEERVLLVDHQAYDHGDTVYHTLKEAVDYVNANPPVSEAERVTILMAPGVYREQVLLTAPYVTLKPMDASAGEVKVTWYYGCGNYYNDVVGAVSATNSWAFSVDKGASDFIAEDIVFENSYNIYLVEDELTACQERSYEQIKKRFDANDATINQTQALAVRCAGDRAVFKRCTFLGRQDTLMFPTGSKRAYLEDCYIEGTVDFIYADGTVVFNKCTINSPYNSGYVTAPSTPSEEKYGFLFVDCELTREAKNGKAAPKDNSYSLARTWGPDAMNVFWNCKMDKHIRTNNDRFAPMGENTAENARYFEVGSMDIDGNPLDLDSFVNTERETILTQDDMKDNGDYAAWKWLWGNDQWNPAGFDVPTE